MTVLWRPPHPDWVQATSAKAEAAQRFVAQIVAAHPDVALASSLQIEDAVITDLLARVGAPFAVFMLETGRLPEETSLAKRAIEDRYDIEIKVFKPDSAEIADWVERHGQDAFYDNVELRKECCAIRKVRPLARALVGRSAWITGQRREQAQSRERLSEHEFDTAHGIEKFNPLASWTQADVWAYARARAIPVHPLYERGYASIGCEPCTRAIRADENIRAGRWWWEANDSKECGLHVGDAGAPIVTA